MADLLKNDKEKMSVAVAFTENEWSVWAFQVAGRLWDVV